MAGSTPERPISVINGERVRLDLMMPHDELQEGVGQVDRVSAAAFAGHSVLAISILKGARPFAAAMLSGRFGAMVRHTHVEVQLSSRRNGMEGPGELQIVQDIPEDVSVAGQHAFVMEDLVDSGYCMSLYAQKLLDQGAASVTIASALNKPSARKFELPSGVAHISAFDVHQDLWVTGYGMDIADEHRELKGIWVPETQLAEVPVDQWYQPSARQIAR
ncbi:MAG TPA: hypothetical protein VLI54_06360 [Bacillota bacterium]|nr:hypothetical protein [Bacillota bacterium]